MTFEFADGDKLHEPGECPTGHKWCSGLGAWGPDPFAEEIHNDKTPVFQCSGTDYESAQEI